MLKKFSVVTGIVALGSCLLFLSPQQAVAGHGGGGGHMGGGHMGGGFHGGYVGGYHGGYVGGYHGGYYGGYGYRGGYYGLGYGGYGLGYGGLGFGGYGYGLGSYYPYYGAGIYSGGYYPSYYTPYYSGGYSNYSPYLSSSVATPGYYGNTIDPNSQYSTDVSQAAYQSQVLRSAAPTDNTSFVTVHVPANAKVWFDGVETKANGALREFKSPPLTPGAKYHYDVKATWEENGKPVTQTRQVEVSANSQVSVDFPTTPNTPNAPQVTGNLGK